MQDQNTEPNHLALLRTALALAEQTALQAAGALQTLQAEILALYLPVLNWPLALQKLHHLYTRRHVQAQREFRCALRFLQTQEALSAQQKTLAQNQQTPAPEPKSNPHPSEFQQTLLVYVENGQTITEYQDFTTPFLVSIGPWPDAAYLTRNIFFRDFRDQPVPPEYQWTLIEGAEPAVPELVELTYDFNAFRQLALLEIEAHSPHAFPGNPLRKRYEKFLTRT